MTMKSEYMPFYVMGRADDEPNVDVDVEEIEEKVMKGADLRETTLAVATKVCAPRVHDRAKRKWLAEVKEEISEAGGDSEEAYRHYMKGQVDQLAASLEADVVELMTEEDEIEKGVDLGDDDDDGDGDDDRDDDDEDETH